jgi:hypothetical protein
MSGISLAVVFVVGLGVITSQDGTAAARAEIERLIKASGAEGSRVKKS